MPLETHYFPEVAQWRNWLEANHSASSGVFLIFYKVDHDKASMRWEEAVQEALCFGWIDSTVKSLGNGKRRQYFCPRKAGSTWSRINKDYISELKRSGRMHPSGNACIRAAQADGSWTALDGVENGDVPQELEAALRKHPEAHTFFYELSKTYRKSYLYWLFQAKREATRAKRISAIVENCAAGLKTREP